MKISQNSLAANKAKMASKTPKQPARSNGMAKKMTQKSVAGNGLKTKCK